MCEHLFITHMHLIYFMFTLVPTGSHFLQNISTAIYYVPTPSFYERHEKQYLKVTSNSI